jgi:hypothetical protein
METLSTRAWLRTKPVFGEKEQTPTTIMME